MSHDLVFYTNPRSRGSIVQWALEEISCRYRTEILDYGTTMKAPAYLAINPMGKVPAITHGSQVVTEAAAICVYLAGAFPGAGLGPKPGHEGDYYRWLFFAAACAEPAILNHAEGWDPATPEQRTRFGYGSYEDAIDTLANWLKGRDHVAGSAFSAADIVVCSLLGFGMMGNRIDKRPEFTAYTTRHTARPAYLRAREIMQSQLLRAA
jgi:glutathione S-transferase